MGIHYDCEFDCGSTDCTAPERHNPYYARHIAWGKTVMTVSGCKSWADATNKVLDLAIRQGWTNPKWWQFWRYGDTIIEQESIDNYQPIE